MAEAKAGSLGRGLPAGQLAAELAESLCQREGLRIERIVSTGQRRLTANGTIRTVTSGCCSWPAPRASSSMARTGSASLPPEIVLLPAHCRHRVTWTECDPPTVWLAIHVALD